MNCFRVFALGVLLALIVMSVRVQQPQAHFRIITSGYSTPTITPPPPACLHAPRGFGCGTNPTLRAGFLTYTAAAGDNSAALASEFSTASSAGKDVLIGPNNAVITVSPATAVNTPANINIQCAPGVVLDESASTSTTFNGFYLLHSASDGGSFANCIVRGHNWNLSPPGAPNQAANGPWLMFHDATSAPINGYTVVNNYFTGPAGQCAFEIYTSNGTAGAQNIVTQYNTFDKCALYGPCLSGGTNITYQHDYITGCAAGNENNSNAQPYGVTFNDEETHFGGGNACFNGSCGHPAGNIHDMYLQVCGNDNSNGLGTMSGAAGHANNLIINGDGTGYQLIPSDNCVPNANMTGNVLLNQATCVCSNTFSSPCTC